MASIDTDVLKNMIATGVQIIAYRTDPKAVWTAIPSRMDHETEKQKFADIPDMLHAYPVMYDPNHECWMMQFPPNKSIYMLKFSNGWEWSHERGLYDSNWKEPEPPVKTVEKYYRIRITGDDVQFTEMTAEINELVQASKELAAIVIGAKVAIDSFKGEMNA